MGVKVELDVYMCVGVQVYNNSLFFWFSLNST